MLPKADETGNSMLKKYKYKIMTRSAALKIF